MRPLSTLRLLLALLLFVALPLAAQDPDILPVSRAFRLSVDTTTPGVLKLHWNVAPDYYLYRGRIKFTPGDGLTLGQAEFPQGEKHDDPYFGPVELYFHAFDVTLPYTLAAGAPTLKLAVQYQGCHQVDPKICFPPQTEPLDIPLTLLGSQITPPPSADTQEADEATHGFSKALARLGKQPTVAEQTPPTVAPAPAPRTAPDAATPGLLLSLLLAFAGGLVLNLMPCVLPVLSFKSIGLLESGESPARARRHALAYTVGVLISFATLGFGVIMLRHAGYAVGQGSQLQNPVVVAALALVMTAVGFSLSDLTQVGAGLANIGSRYARLRGFAGDFFTGVLVVLVASPCTTPFMGAALAYAFLAPPSTSLAIFLALGLGLAAPFLLIGFLPRRARLLPRPGPWMETLKQALAFPMYLTAVWLAWVLTRQRGADAVALLGIAAVLLALGLWWHERARRHGMAQRMLARLVLMMSLAPIYLIAQLPPPAQQAQAIHTLPYSETRLVELRQSGTPVFVAMTADWCITCKFNAHAVLDTPAFRDLLERHHTVYMKGDWTNLDAGISRFLERYHSPGVPLYVLFPKHGGEARILPNVLTQALAARAVTEAAP